MLSIYHLLCYRFFNYATIDSLTLLLKNKDRHLKIDKSVSTSSIRLFQKGQ